VQAAIARADSEDVVVLLPGVHEGRIRVDRAVHLRGEAGAIVFGGRNGDVIEVVAPAPSSRISRSAAAAGASSPSTAASRC